MSVDITEILLAITVSVGHCEFEMRRLDMDDVIQLGVLDLFMKQVMKTPFRFEFFSVQYQGSLLVVGARRFLYSCSYSHVRCPVRRSIDKVRSR